MKLGLMQPYFFPYIEYFRLIAACDLFILFDTAQFSRGSWMSRNRILDAQKGWSYINVPVRSQGRRFQIRAAEIDTATPWKKIFRDKLKIYFSAPHYRETADVLDAILAPGHHALLDFNAHALRQLCDLLDCNTRIETLTALDLLLPEACPPGEWALAVCKALGADEYINPSGGKAIYDFALYRAEGVTLSFHKHINFTYNTGPFEFVPDLSILDAMMWVDRDRLREVMV